MNSQEIKKDFINKIFENKKIVLMYQRTTRENQNIPLEEYTINPSDDVIENKKHFLSVITEQNIQITTYKENVINVFFKSNQNTEYYKEFHFEIIQS